MTPFEIQALRLKKRCKSCIRVILGLYSGYVGVVSRLYWGYIGDILGYWKIEWKVLFGFKFGDFALWPRPSVRFAMGSSGRGLIK